MKEKLGGFALISIGILSLLILIFVFVKFLLPVILPFIIAWLIASITVKPARKMAEGTKVPERVLRLMLSLLLTLSVAGVLGLSIWKIIEAIWRFIADLGEGNRFYELLSTLFSAEIPLIGDKIPEELATRIKDAISSALSEVFSALASGATGLVGNLPRAFFVLVVTLISLVYFAIDYDRISRFVKSLLPERAVKGIAGFRDGIFTVIRKYLLSYSLILLITFAVMLTGFMLLRVEHALLIAIVVALLDILPVIGVGTVLIPWSIVELSIGNHSLGIGLLVLFVLNTIIRQLAEPKIVGKNLSLHPIVALILLYVGYSLFGIVGLIVLPVIAISLGVALKGDNTAEIG